MSFFDHSWGWEPLSRVRRNHALEHATLQMLARGRRRPRLAGYSDLRGFWIVGEVSLEELQAAVEEALERLRNGEYGLAIHPNCGTNFALSGLLAGCAAWLSMLNSGPGLRRKAERLPLVITLVTLALIVAQPLGPLAQARLTTQPRIGSLQVIEITGYRRGGIPMHRVVTRY